MADPHVAKGGYIRVRLTWTKNNAPWNDVADYAAVAQIRERPGDDALTAWDITYDEESPNVMILTLPKPKSVLLADGARLLWDVLFTKPEGEESDEDLRTFYWPPAGQERKKLWVTGTITEAPDA